MAITAARSRDCNAYTGGIKAIYLSDASAVTSFTLTGDDYSAVVMSGMAVFYKHEFQPTTAEFREAGEQADRTSGFSIVQEIEMAWKGMNSTDRAAIEDIKESSTCGVIAIVETVNADKFVVGYNEDLLKEYPMYLASDTTTSGKALTDPIGAILILRTESNEKARVFTGTVPV